MQWNNTFRREDRKVEICEYLRINKVASLATFNASEVHIATIFYIYHNGSIFYKSKTTSIHSQNILINKFGSIIVLLY
jgi:nitroimidazol reductase NimA-like FMN-containing flavoprotein (pyridoxamine 5'-phosphate oxidase superfamily)